MGKMELPGLGIAVTGRLSFNYQVKPISASVTVGRSQSICPEACRPNQPSLRCCSKVAAKAAPTSADNVFSITPQRYV